jgi:tetratricopeptide (TPR) repeat protein
MNVVISNTGTDSPVFKMLPRLTAPSPTVLRVVPQDFRESVDYAQQTSQRGDLRLLANETDSLEWASEGLRTVGRAQFSLGDWPGARDSFEELRKSVPGDVEANQRLGTIYQKLGDLTRSNQAIQRVIESMESTANDRAEAFALQGRNAKSRWLKRLEPLAEGDQPAAALKAAELDEAIDRYAEGFEQDLNHFYSGLNALSLLRIKKDLAAALPKIWGKQFNTDEEQEASLRALDARFSRLEGAVQMSIQARLSVLKRQQPPDLEQLMWARISEADCAFATLPTSRAVARRYDEALSNATKFGKSAARDQIEIFRRLGVRLEFVEEALAAIDGAVANLADAPSKPKEIAPDRVLLFTGHRIDDAGRPAPRFPRSAAAELEARRMIKESIEAERKLEPGRLVAIAGGASGGDILFHEICDELGIESRLYLALPPDLFSAASVQSAGKEWTERYNALLQRRQPRVLSETKDLPIWLQSRRDYSTWQRNNLWMLFNALALEAKSLTLIALWDGGPSDGVGGTEDLVAQIAARGQKVDRLPAENLKNLAAI